MNYLKTSLPFGILLFISFIQCDSIANPEYELAKGSIESKPSLAKPVLEKPDNAGTSESSAPLLSWKKVSGAEVYQVLITDSEHFDSVLVDANTRAIEYKTNGLSYEKIYYWKVRAIDKDSVIGPWSEKWNFSTPPKPGEETAVTTTLETPAQGSEDQQPELTLHWTKVTNAHSYRVQLSTSSEFSSTQRDSTVETDSYHITGLSHDQAYYWRVKPNIENKETKWSEVFNFSTKSADVDVTKPQISVSGSQQTVYEGETFTIDASASDSSEIASIEIYADEKKIKTCSNSTTCSHSSNSYSVGTHTFHAIAVDASPNANKTKSEIKKFDVTAVNAPGKKVKTMPLGDSITEAFGYRIPLWNKLTEKDYTIDYVGSQSDPHPDLPDTDHEGHGGWNIGNVSEKVNGWLSTHQPDIVLLMIGTNDVAWWSARNGAEIADAHASLVDQILDHTGPETWILVASIPPQSSKIIEPNKIDRAQLTRDFNSEMKKRMQQRIDNGKKIVFVDIHSKLTVNDLSDGIHPDQNGYEIIAQTWFENLQTVFSSY